VPARLIRWWDDAPLRVKGIVVIGIPLMPLVVMAGLFLLGARNAGTAADWMGRAYRTQTEMVTVLRQVVDADAAIAEFAATHSPDALGPAENADRALPPAVDRLRALWSTPIRSVTSAVAAMITARPFAVVVDAAPSARLDGPDPLVAPAAAAPRAAARTGGDAGTADRLWLSAPTSCAGLVWLAVGAPCSA
jgi:hypothetical protein